MTIKNKLIKTMYLYGRVANLEADKAVEFNSVESFLFQEDITIIGVLGHAWVDFYTAAAENYEEGRFQAYPELSRSGHLSHDGVIMKLPVHVRLGVEAAYAIAWGKDVEHQVVMFPEGYGIDVDDGEYLYINMDYSMKGLITDDPSGEMACHFILYYVER